MVLVLEDWPFKARGRGISAHALADCSVFVSLSVALLASHGSRDKQRVSYLSIFELLVVSSFTYIQPGVREHAFSLSFFPWHGDVMGTYFHVRGTK